MASSFLSRLVVAAAFLGLAGAAQAVLIFDDSVPVGGTDYTGTSSNLVPQNPTSTYGFNAAWVGAGTNLGASSGANISMSGIANNGGNSLKASSGSTGLPSSRQFTRGFAPVSGAGTLWMGSLVNFSLPNGAANGSAFVGVLSGNLGTGSVDWSTYAGGAGLKGFQVGESGGFLTVNYQTAAGGVAAFGQTVTSTVISGSTPYFLVTRLDLNTSGVDDTLSVWLLTSAPADESGLGAATFTISNVDIATSSQDLTTLALTEHSTVVSTYNFDAMRMGTTYTDLTTAAVPEPSSLAAMALGMLALVAVVRRRKELAA